MAIDNLIYNARYSNINQIAESFTINDQYIELIKPNHSIITGPRGCGKTTLLKMLTPNAVDVLSKIHKGIPVPNFVGIYIPADKQWLRQHLTLKRRIVDENIYKPIIKCLINCNCIISIVNTLEYLVQSRVQTKNLSKKLETEIVFDIKATMHLGNDFPNTFHHLKQYFYQVVSDLNTKINKYYFGYLSIKDIDLHDIAFIEIPNLVQPIYEIFYHKIGEFNAPINRTSWALSFDELEISPSWLINDLISTYFRSTYQNLLLKVTGTPIITAASEASVSAPQIGHDFNRIECWVYDARSRRRWASFCEKFINDKYGINELNSLLKKHDYTDAIIFSEKEMRPEISDSDEKSSNEWHEGSTMWKVFVKLAKIDISFKEFLISKKINPDNPIPTKEQTDSIHRKIKPLVAFRYYFNKSEAKRSRKAVHLYFGVEHLIELTDGNPRMFLNLLSKYDYYFKNKMKIPINVQSQNILNFSNEVYTSFKDDPEGYSFNDYSLQRLLDKVGQFIFNEIVVKPFSMDPVSCFTVDSKTQENVRQLVLYGLETGALQLIKDNDSENLDTIIDKKIRLSYSLHPKYHIPKRTYNSIKIESILRNSDTLTLF